MSGTTVVLEQDAHRVDAGVLHEELGETRGGVAVQLEATLTEEDSIGRLANRASLSAEAVIASDAQRHHTGGKLDEGRDFSSDAVVQTAGSRNTRHYFVFREGSSVATGHGVQVDLGGNLKLDGLAILDARGQGIARLVFVGQVVDDRTGVVLQRTEQGQLHVIQDLGSHDLVLNDAPDEARLGLVDRHSLMSGRQNRHLRGGEGSCIGHRVALAVLNLNLVGMLTGGKRSRPGIGHVGRVRILRSHGGRHDLSVDGQLDAVGGND